jgi:hypothetical protein
MRSVRPLSLIDHQTNNLSGSELLSRNMLNQNITTNIRVLDDLKIRLIKGIEVI